MSFRNALQATQKSVLQYAKQGRPYEIISAIMDARNCNTTIVEKDMEVEVEGKRQFSIKYYAHVAYQNVEPIHAFCELSKKTTSAIYQLNRDDIRFFGGEYSFSDHAKAAINAALPAVRRKLTVDIAKLLVDNVGMLPTGEALGVFSREEDKRSLSNLKRIQEVYVDNQFSDPIIIGGDDVFYWRKGVNGNTADTDTRDSHNLYHDSLINDAFDDPNCEHLLCIDPQMLKFISFNRNAGIFATDLQNIDAIDSIYTRSGNDSIKGVLADPLTALLWDLNINYDKCNYRWTFQWVLEWDIFFMPSSILNIPGVNGICHFTNGNNTSPEVDMDVTSRVFEWNTYGVLTFPLYVHKLDIAGQTLYPSVTVASVPELRNLFNDSTNGYVFNSSGTKLSYNGYSGISGKINDATTIEFSHPNTNQPME